MTKKEHFKKIASTFSWINKHVERGANKRFRAASKLTGKGSTVSDTIKGNALNKRTEKQLNRINTHVIRKVEKSNKYHAGGKNPEVADAKYHYKKMNPSRKNLFSRKTHTFSVPAN